MRIYTQDLCMIMPFLQANWQFFIINWSCFCWCDLPLEMGLRSSG